MLFGAESWIWMVDVTEAEPMTRLVRSLRSGQITIPAEFRNKLGIEDDSLLQVSLVGGELRIKPVNGAERTTGSPWIEELYAHFASAREAAAKYDEDEINADLDRALADVRRGRD
jgi:AbrB family looped-hinge helix DNA binding protein